MEQLPKIVQQRLQATARPGVHPDPDLLAAFAEMSLNERERAHVMEHLAQCTDCRQVVSLATPEIVVPSTIPARSTWLSWPVLRWGALAACVVVISAAVTLHYGRGQNDRPQSFSTTVAEPASAPAPSPSTTVTLESRDSKPGQKLAAKIVPPSPFQSENDLAVVGKLAKQGNQLREDAPARAAASPSVANGLDARQFANRRLENIPPGTAIGKDKADRDQLADKQIAKMQTDELKASSAPPAAPTAQMSAAAPAAPAADAKAKTADAEAQAKVPGENLDSAPSGLTETVTVEAEAPRIETSTAEVSRSKKESRNKVQSAGSAGMNLPMAGRNASQLAVLTKIAPRWTVSPDGALQRSLDSGKTWQTIPVASHIVFRALAANDADVWAGGASGALYHSSDAGEHWTQINPVADGKPLTADIVRVEFTDPRHGRLIAGDGETWTTGDAGENWHK